MIRLAGGPVSWGVDSADAPGNPPYEDVLAGIAAAGLRWMELGPVGYVPPTAPAADGIGVVGTFVFDAFHAAARGDAGGGDAAGDDTAGDDTAGDDTAAARDVLAAVDAALDAIVASEGRLLVLIDRPCDARAATAGRSDAAPRLRDPAPMLEL